MRGPVELRVEWTALPTGRTAAPPEPQCEERGYKDCSDGRGIMPIRAPTQLAFPKT
jgi:hypothetical protein